MNMETNTIKIQGFNYPKAKVREDILEQNLSVPVGEGYYGLPEALAYRWKDADTDEEQFQVYLNGQWQDAQSIDFEF
jgi:hypothetical protein